MSSGCEADDRHEAQHLHRCASIEVLAEARETGEDGERRADRDADREAPPRPAERHPDRAAERAVAAARSQPASQDRRSARRASWWLDPARRCPRAATAARSSDDAEQAARRRAARRRRVPGGSGRRARARAPRAHRTGGRAATGERRDAHWPVAPVVVVDCGSTSSDPAAATSVVVAAVELGLDVDLRGISPAP